MKKLLASLNSDTFAFLLFIATMAIPVGLILAAPVMRQPANGTIAATDYFGDK
jgi:hypothetical protein